MAETVNPSIGIQSGNTTVRLEGEIGSPSKPGPTQDPTASQLNSVGATVTTINGDNTSTSIGVKIGTDPTNPSAQVNFQFGQRQDGQAVPTTTESTWRGQPISLPGMTTVYPGASPGTTIGAGVNITSEPRVLQTPTPENPNAQFIAGQTYVGAGVAVNLQTGQAAGNIVAGGQLVAPSSTDEKQIPGASVGAQLQIGGGGVNLSPNANVLGTAPPPMDAAFDAVRFKNNPPPAGNTQPGVDPQVAVEALRRSPEYGQALSGLQQQGFDRNPAPDSPTDRLATAIALDAQKKGVPVSGVDLGSTVFNAQGNSDRNVFYGGQSNSELRVSESQALNTPVAQQMAKAQEQQAQTPQVQPAPTQQMDSPTQEAAQRR